MTHATSPAAATPPGHRLPDHRIEMRWSDLDILEHVNNVVYLEYVDDARESLSSALGPARRVASCDIEYLQALELTDLPVIVTSRLSGDLLHQEVAVAYPAGRTIHARVTTRLVTEFEPLAPIESPTRSTRVSLRARDLDGGSAVNSAMFGFFQEARILSLGRREPDYPGGRVVVARSSMRYASAIPMRTEPYEVRSAIERIGRSSVTMRLQLVDTQTVLAETTSTFVAFDSSTKRSRPFGDAERDHMLSRVPMAAAPAH